MSLLPVGAQNPIIQNVYLAEQQQNIKINPKEYLYAFKSGKVLNRTGVVLLSTAIGTGVGAAVGSTVAGVGMAPGAGIGAATGFVVGVVSCLSFDVYKYKKWKEGQKKEVVTVFMEKIVDMVNRTEFICPITGELIRHPAVTPNTPNTYYEYEALFDWVQNHGTDPMTRAEIKVEDIKASVFAIGSINNLCKQIIAKEIALDNEQKVINLTPIELEGIKAMQEDLDDTIMNMFKDRKKKLTLKVEKGLISIKDYVQDLQRFSDAAGV